MLHKLKSELMQAVNDKRSKKEILKAIRAAGYQPEDLSAEYGYMNIRVHACGGYVRIYRPNSGRSRGAVIFQVWEPVKLTYSGAPMFSSNPLYF